MKDLAQAATMEGKAESHRFKNWKHKGRDAEVFLLVYFLFVKVGVQNAKKKIHDNRSYNSIFVYSCS